MSKKNAIADWQNAFFDDAITKMVTVQIRHIQENRRFCEIGSEQLPKMYLGLFV